MSLSTVAVPQLDLSTTSPDELVEALISSSCVFLTGHGLTETELSALIGTAAEFYAQSETEKEAVRWPGSGPWRGWQPVYQGGPSALLLERFEVSLAPGGHTLALEDWAETFKLWPAEPAAMKPAWSAVYRRMHGLASRLTAMIASGLQLPSEDLPAWTERQFSNLVVNHYLRQDTAPEPGRVRQRAHSDIGGITLLWADDSPGGLQAQIGPDGSWVPITFPPGCLLLQAGDLLNLWTSGRIPANLHRVVNPSRDGEQVQTDRYSAVFFHHPDLTTWVAPDQVANAGVGAQMHVLGRQEMSARQDALPS